MNAISPTDARDERKEPDVINDRFTLGPVGAGRARAAHHISGPVPAGRPKRHAAARRCPSRAGLRWHHATIGRARLERPKEADGTPTPIPNTADTGYFSKKAVEGLEKIGIDPYIAVGRQKHHETPVAPESAAPSAEASAEGLKDMHYKASRSMLRRLYHSPR